MALRVLIPLDGSRLAESSLTYLSSFRVLDEVVHARARGTRTGRECLAGRHSRYRKQQKSGVLLGPRWLDYQFFLNSSPNASSSTC